MPRKRINGPTTCFESNGFFFSKATHAQEEDLHLPYTCYPHGEQRKLNPAGASFMVCIEWGTLTLNKDIQF